MYRSEFNGNHASGCNPSEGISSKYHSRMKKKGRKPCSWICARFFLHLSIQYLYYGLHLRRRSTHLHFQFSAFYHILELHGRYGQCFPVELKLFDIQILLGIILCLYHKGISRIILLIQLNGNLPDFITFFNFSYKPALQVSVAAFFSLIWVTHGNFVSSCYVCA